VGGVQMFNNLNEVWEFIIDESIATDEELQLITSINGYNLEALNDVIYARSGYHTMEQYKESEGE